MVGSFQLPRGKPEDWWQDDSPDTPMPVLDVLQKHKATGADITISVLPMDDR